MAETVERMVGRRIEAERSSRGWTQNRLARSVSDLGGPTMHQAQIARIEDGARRVKVDEWLWFAAALNVPPIMLLVDLESGEDVSVTPQHMLHPDLARKWVAGEAPALGGVDNYMRAARPVSMYRKHDLLMESVNGAQKWVRRHEGTGDSHGLQKSREWEFEALEQLASHRHHMGLVGVEPPDLDESLNDRIAELGIKED